MADTEHTMLAEAFNDRAPTYARSDWHRQYAERLVELCPLQPGWRVVDAGTGTGFAAAAASRVVGPAGWIVGVDVSPQMLARARASVVPSAPSRVMFLRADATRLPLPSRSVDAVICSAALLYMPVGAALAEWRRILRPGGVIGFSTMQAGHPPAASLFRRVAASFGVHLSDPSAPLGSDEACREALSSQGFDVRAVTSETVHFQPSDLERAWDVHARMYANELRVLSPRDRAQLEAAYRDALDAAQHTSPAFYDAAVLYAFGTVLATKSTT